jgi:hypothetical protein
MAGVVVIAIGMRHDHSVYFHVGAERRAKVIASVFGFGLVRDPASSVHENPLSIRALDKRRVPLAHVQEMQAQLLPARLSEQRRSRREAHEVASSRALLLWLRLELFRRRGRLGRGVVWRRGCWSCAGRCGRRRHRLRRGCAGIGRHRALGLCWCLRRRSAATACDYEGTRCYERRACHGRILLPGEQRLTFEREHYPAGRQNAKRLRSKLEQRAGSESVRAEEITMLVTQQHAASTAAVVPALPTNAAQSIASSTCTRLK